jgi:hypothetical protein
MITSPTITDGMVAGLLQRAVRFWFETWKGQFASFKLGWNDSGVVDKTNKQEREDAGCPHSGQAVSYRLSDKCACTIKCESLRGFRAKLALGEVSYCPLGSPLELRSGYVRVARMPRPCPENLIVPEIKTNKQSTNKLEIDKTKCKPKPVTGPTRLSKLANC